MSDNQSKHIQAWDKEFSEETVVDIGPIVVCDICNKDYTDSPESGGFLFGSYAYCPPCAEEAEPRIESYGESHYISKRCPEGKSFADWVRELRGGNNTISVTRLK